MSSTFSTILRIELIADGEQDSSWGGTLRTQLGTIMEAAIAGRSAVTHDDTANYTLTTANGSADEARRAILNIAGALTAARNTVCPTQSKLYVVKNATTGGFATTLKTSAGTGIAIPNGKTTFLMCDGTNVVDAIDYLSTLTVGNILVVTAGGLTVTGDVRVTAADKLYLDGGGDTYLIEVGANEVQLVVGGIARADWTTTVFTSAVRIDVDSATLGIQIGAYAGRSVTNPSNAVNLLNGTAPSGTLADGVTLYSASGELRVMDAGGTSTLLSPHDDEGRWVYDSQCPITGKHLRIDMEKLIKAVNEKFGWDFVHEFDLE